MHVNGSCVYVCLLLYVHVCQVPLCISYSGNGAQAADLEKSECKAGGEQVVGKGSNSFSFGGCTSEANTFLLFQPRHQLVK